MPWQSTIEFLGGASVIGAVMGYLGKAAIDAYLAGRIEQHKAELDRLTTEHSIRFQRLHTERAEIIKDFYAKIATLDETLVSTLAAFQRATDTPLPEKVNLLAAQFNGTRDFFISRRIFFDPETCARVDEVLEIAKGIFFDITVLDVDPLHGNYKYDRGLLNERHEFWEKARGSHQNGFKPLKEKLEAQFRAILGIGA